MMTIQLRKGMNEAISGSKTQGNWMLMGKTDGIEGHARVVMGLCGEALQKDYVTPRPSS